MTITINGSELTDLAVEQELSYHQHSDNPLKTATHELILRKLVLQQALSSGLDITDEDAAIEALLRQEVNVPTIDTASCQTYYGNNQQKFSAGELLEARHILFQVTPDVDLDLLRGTAEAVLAELQQHTDRFSALAQRYSNCPSGQVGGSLGQLSRGQTVPEFESMVFRMAPGKLLGRLLETRFGLHIVQVLRYTPGLALPFEAVHQQIADTLSSQAWQRGVHQYLKILVGLADLQGISLEGADSPLIQ